MRDPAITRAAFEAFHAANPHVLLELATHARELKAAGVPPGEASIWTLVYHRRYVTLLERAQGALVEANDDPKNDWTPYYARVLDAACADLTGWLALGGMKVRYVPDLGRLGLINVQAPPARHPLPPPPPLPCGIGHGSRP